jgi:hypothetical protein
MVKLLHFYKKVTTMAIPDIFTKEVSEGIITRINGLSSQTAPKWGKMSVSQMLAHCCVTYEYIFENKYKKPNAIMGLVLKMIVKGAVVGEKPYKHGSPTGPDFVVKDDRNFDVEKQRLIGFIRQTQALGGAHFDGKASHSFGVLNKAEWNNMFYKHLDHHLTQFGV